MLLLSCILNLPSKSSSASTFFSSSTSSLFNFISSRRNARVSIAYILWSFLARALLLTRNATWAGYLSKAAKPFCASQVSIFNPPDHTDTALTRCYGLLQWPDCTLSPLETWALKNRQVTQSIATQMSLQQKLLFLNRRSCPTRTLLSCVKYWPFSPILPVLKKYISWTNFWKRC